MQGLPTEERITFSPVITRADAGSGRDYLILRIVIIVLAGLFVYAPAFHGEWLWDDDQEITENPVLRDPAGLVKIWTGNCGADFFPLKTTFQWLLFFFMGTNGTGYHIVNVVLHLVSALLVWRLFFRLGIAHAWLGALLFCIHPILVESVAWISELKNTLSLPLLLLSMISYIGFDERGRWQDYAWAIVFFLASALCKSSVVMFPFVVLLFCWWKRGTDAWRRDLLRSIPFFLISLVLGLVTVSFQHGRAIGDETILVGGLASRTATAGMAILFYIYKTVLPLGLLPIYPKWQVDPPSLAQFLPWPIIFGSLVWFWFKRASWGKHALLGVGFFLLNVFPVLGFVTMSYMRITWVADHFVYLPAIGIIGLLTAAVGSIYEREGEGIRASMKVIVAVVLGALLLASHAYAEVFSNEIAMWSYTLKRNPDAWQAHSRYGKAMAEIGDSEAAYYHIREAARLRPDLAETHNNYATMLGAKGELDHALVELKEACRIAPKMPIYTLNLGKLLVKLQKYEEANALYGGELEKDPKSAVFLCNYGVTLYLLGKKEEALAKFEEALQNEPNLQDARTNLEAVSNELKNGTKPPEMLPSAPNESSPLSKPFSGSQQGTTH